MRNKRAILVAAALCAGMFCGTPGWADNIVVSDAKLAGPVKGTHGTARFNVQWEHSWRLDLPGTNQAEPYNYDAAWVFVKYRAGNGEWKHATLSTNAADHVVPAGVALSVGQTDGKGIGVFLYRSANGAGTFKANDVGLRWLYPSNGIGDAAAVTVKVFAMEMVYVTQGAFWVGDGREREPNNMYSDGQFMDGGSDHPRLDRAMLISTNPGVGEAYFQAYKKSMATATCSPLRITSENELTVGDSPGQLFYTPDGYLGMFHSGDGLGPIPAAFPKGYAAFYGMKYEITQGQYVDFLNTLSVAQATNRWPFMNNAILRKDLALGYAHRYAITNTSPVCLSNLLGKARAAPASPDSVVDAAAVIDSAWNDEPDWKDICGKFTTSLPNVACNMLDWPDVAGYLDWAGLRPMTELEYEKACRGPLPPVAGEYAWGNANLVRATGIINGGTINEAPANPDANCVVIGSGPGGVNGPMRVGCTLGMGTGSRTAMDAGYYGMMDLSGNVVEKTVSLAVPIGRRFTGRHGDGVLEDATGNANVPGWPATDGSSERQERRGVWVKVEYTNYWWPSSVGLEGIGSRGGLEPGYVYYVSKRFHGTHMGYRHNGKLATLVSPEGILGRGWGILNGGRGVRTAP